MRPDADFLPQRKPMNTAMVLSVLFHALLFSLSFGNQGLGLPGLDLPWRERRFEADDLRVVLEPATILASPAVPSLVAASPAAASPKAPPANHVPKPMAQAEPSAATEAMAAAPSPAGDPGDMPSPVTPTETVMAVDRSDVATLAVPVAPLVPAPTPVVAAAPSTKKPETAASAPQQGSGAAQKPIDQDAKEAREAKEAQESKERALERAKLDRQKQEEQRQASQIEATRVETARVEATRQAAVRQEAEQAEAARLEGERQEAARQEVARQEKLAARAQEDARRDAVRRAMGRQLDEEAAKREAASRAANPSSTLPSSWSSARRGRLFGRADANAELVLYAEAWSRKIELNMTFDMVREAVKQRHTHPLVTVALRSDGSVESVTIVVSSGVPAIDEAVRRIVQSQAPYPQFPPALAREYDVIEIRRSWYFDSAIRLF